MATPTYDPIASTTLTLPALSVTFSSLDTIAAGYRDLVLVVDALGNGGGVQANIRVNSDTGSNYSYVVMRGNGSTATSASGTNNVAYMIYSGSATATQSSLSTCAFFDYSQTDKHKSILVRTDNSGATQAIANRWSNTSAITSITVLVSGVTAMAAGSTFSLYGIAA